MSIISNQYLAVRVLSENQNTGLYCVKWLDQIRRFPDKTFQPLKINTLLKRHGRFLWIECQGKGLTNLELWVPCFYLDHLVNNGDIFLRVLSFNFMRIYDRMIYFDKLFAGLDNFFHDQVLMENSEKERALGNMYQPVYSSLGKYGYQWAIREINIKNVKKAFDVSWSHSGKFLAADTSLYTGVKDTVIENIWKSKNKEV